MPSHHAYRCHQPAWSGVHVELKLAIRDVDELDDRIPRWANDEPERGSCAVDRELECAILLGAAPSKVGRDHGVVGRANTDDQSTKKDEPAFFERSADSVLLVFGQGGTNRSACGNTLLPVGLPVTCFDPLTEPARKQLSRQPVSMK